MCRTSFYKRPSICACGLYIRVNQEDESHFAFVDICEQKTVDIEEDLKFRYYNSHSFASLNFNDLNCSSQVDKEDDEKSWENVPLSYGHFKCAQLKSELNFCVTYVVSSYFVFLLLLLPIFTRNTYDQNTNNRVFIICRKSAISIKLRLK